MNRFSCAIALLAIFCASCTTNAMVSHMKGGHWPQTWTTKLNPLRRQATTLEVATGIHEHIYTITFESKEQFERFWPILIKVRTPGSPLTLSNIGKMKPGWGNLISNAKPCVRIKGPSGGYSVGKPTLGERLDKKEMEKGIENGTTLLAGAPWPKDIVGTNGALPKYVTAEKIDGDKLSWRPVDDLTKEKLAVFSRARTEIELVIDGDVIDLNLIELPDDALLIDERFTDWTDN